MSSVAVEVRHPNGVLVKGILTASFRKGWNCDLYLGNDKHFRIPQVKGWLTEVGSDRVLIFDINNQRYQLEVIARSTDFL
jgi:hypothetical protein